MHFHRGSSALRSIELDQWGNRPGRDCSVSRMRIVSSVTTFWGRSEKPLLYTAPVYFKRQHLKDNMTMYWERSDVKIRRGGCRDINILPDGSSFAGAHSSFGIFGTRRRKENAFRFAWLRNLFALTLLFGHVNVTISLDRWWAGPRSDYSVSRVLTVSLVVSWGQFGRLITLFLSIQEVSVWKTMTSCIKEKWVLKSGCPGGRQINIVPFGTSSAGCAIFITWRFWDEKGKEITFPAWLSTHISFDRAHSFGSAYSTTSLDRWWCGERAVPAMQAILCPGLLLLSVLRSIQRVQE